MAEHETSRTLVKSPPELWAECSDPASLARHLDGFGEIRITRLEPETAVAWEGERASGTVRLEPAGWGTRVTLTASERADAEADSAGAGPVEAELPLGEVPEGEVPEAAEPEAVGPEAAEPEAVGPEAAEPEAVGPEAAEPRSGFFARLFGFLRREPAPAPDAAPATEAGPAPAEVAEADPEPEVPPRAEAPEPELLSAALDSLGRAHHRPYSRS